MRNAPEVVREVGINDVTMTTEQQFLHLYGGLLGVSPSAVGVDFRRKVGFEDRLLLTTALALVAVLIYIWFRFEWQFGVGVVATLILDVTKTVGFFAVTQIEFDLIPWLRC